jgi:ADP-ribose pyrophosphatase YjhB (NUDIX family)
MEKQNKHPFTPEEFKSIYSQVPRLCVDLVVQSNEGILLTLRALETWNNQWHLPGGTVFVNEKLEDAVKRVAKDELGVSVAIDKVIGVIECDSETKERGWGKSVSVAYLCYLNSKEIKLNADASDAKFFKSAPENILEDQSKFLKSNGLLR